jgi:hypothetical protein
VEKECGIKYCVFKKHTAFPVIQFSQSDIFVHTSLVLMYVGTGFEVFTVVRIHVAVWVRMLCTLVHGYECFGGAFWVCLHGSRKMEAVCPD